jgi:hypothetical protein
MLQMEQADVIFVRAAGDSTRCTKCSPACLPIGVYVPLIKLKTHLEVLYNLITSDREVHVRFFEEMAMKVPLLTQLHAFYIMKMFKQNFLVL